jgi:hypothetical protein
MLDVSKGKLYWANFFQHAKNELLYASNHGTTMLNKVMPSVAHDGSNKMI